MSNLFTFRLAKRMFIILVICFIAYQTITGAKLLIVGAADIIGHTNQIEEVASDYNYLEGGDYE